MNSFFVALSIRYSVFSFRSIQPSSYLRRSPFAIQASPGAHRAPTRYRLSGNRQICSLRVHHVLTTYDNLGKRHVTDARRSRCTIWECWKGSNTFTLMLPARTTECMDRKKGESKSLAMESNCLLYFSIAQLSAGRQGRHFSSAKALLFNKGNLFKSRVNLH